jgi:hypothetical protein
MWECRQVLKFWTNMPPTFLCLKNSVAVDIKIITWRKWLCYVGGLKGRWPVKTTAQREECQGQYERWHGKCKNFEHGEIMPRRNVYNYLWIDTPYYPRRLNIYKHRCEILKPCSRLINYTRNLTYREGYRALPCSTHVINEEFISKFCQYSVNEREYFVQVRVNVSKVKLYIERAMKAQRGSRGVALLFL